MGFSTSGAVVVILIGVLVAVSVIVPTLFSVGAATGEAFSTQSEQLRDQANTDIEVESFETNVSETDEPAVVNVTNTGSSTLSVEKTDVVVAGEYYHTRGVDEETTIVVHTDGNREQRNESDAWAPGAHLEVEIDDEDDDLEEGDPVSITTERGISDRAVLVDTDDSNGEGA